MIRALSFLVSLVIALPLWAGEIAVLPGRGTLATAIAEANPGDVLTLAPGRYLGVVYIDRPLTLTGTHRAVIVGQRQGTVVTIDAPDVTLRNLTIMGSGLDSQAIDAGIKILKKADRALISRNRVLGNLHGIDVHGGLDAQVLDNIIEGTRDRRMNDRGNGIYVWNSPGTIVEGNTVRWGRDGIFSNTSRKGVYRNNLFRDLRFAVHYMYTNHSEVVGNRSENNHIGFALMSSHNLIVREHVSRHDRDRGFLFNYANNIHAERNFVSGGTEKCIFIYNSNKNIFSENLLSDCLIGVHFTAGSERNKLRQNAFINNQTQVKYVGTRWLEWSSEGVGNYWSDHVAFDLDKNGIADSIYRPNDLTDQIIWKYPSARLLMNSPAVQVLKYAQNAFPALHPGGVVDSSPLMQIPQSLSGKVQE